MILRRAAVVALLAVLTACLPLAPAHANRVPPDHATGPTSADFGQVGDCQIFSVDNEPDPSICAIVRFSWVDDKIVVRRTHVFPIQPDSYDGATAAHVTIRYKRGTGVTVKTLWNQAIPATSAGRIWWKDVHIGAPRARFVFTGTAHVPGPDRAFTLRMTVN